MKLLLLPVATTILGFLIGISLTVGGQEGYWVKDSTNLLDEPPECPAKYAPSFFGVVRVGREWGPIYTCEYVGEDRPVSTFDPQNPPAAPSPSERDWSR